MNTFLRALPRSVSRITCATDPTRLSTGLLPANSRKLSVYSRLSSPDAATATRTTTTTTTTNESGTSAETPVAKEPKKRAPRRQKEGEEFQLTKEMMPPKKPPSPFAWWCWYSDKAPPLKSLTFAESKAYVSKAAKEWAQMSDAEKEPFFAARLVAAEKFTIALQEWWRNADPRVVRAINKKRMTRTKPKAKLYSRRALEDRKPASGWSLFVTEHLRNHRNTEENPLDRFGVLGRKWKGMSVEEKAPWNDLAAKNMAEWRARKAEESQDLSSSK